MLGEMAATFVSCTNIRKASVLGYVLFHSRGFHLQVEQSGSSSSRAAVTETDKKIVLTEKEEPEPVSC